ncbi:unnamed protein product [Brassica rapa]|uniref:Uncharacterized protein n=1 Tax=Brassica campestris TaxID=3711 RepID=A0A8D9HKM8_BRACM|nr:unnamed protein product [Brassica rapa]
MNQKVYLSALGLFLVVYPKKNQPLPLCICVAKYPGWIKLIKLFGLTSFDYGGFRKDGASIIGKRSVNNLSQIYEDLAVIINLNNLAMSLLDSREYGRKELSSGILGVYLISEIIIRRWDGGGFSGELKVSRSLQDTWKTLSHQRVRGFACLYTC